MTDVEWRAVPGYEGSYEVSNDGQVRSLDRMGGSRWGPNTRPYPGKVLRPVIRNGYPEVMLYLNSVSRVLGVHRLVAWAFLGPQPPGQQVRHWDGDPSNTHVSNLLYGTPSENQQDSIRHGTKVGLSRTHCPRRHLLVAPNLVVSQVARGHRQCRACQQAWKHPDRKAEADRRYALIMASERTPGPCQDADHVPAPHRTAGTTLPPAVPGRW